MKELVENEFATIINTLKSCLGSTVLLYPYLFEQYGVSLTIILTSICGMTSLFGCCLYVYFNAKLGKNRNLSSIAEVVFPRIQKIVELCLIFKCYFVSCTFLLLLNRLCIELKLIPDFNYPPNPAILILLLILYPINCYNRLTSIKMLSLLGIIGALALVLYSIFLENIKYEKSVIQTVNPLKNIGIFVYGFTSQHSIVQIHNESSSRYKYFIFQIFIVYLAVILFYLGFGYLNFIKFPMIQEEAIVILWPESNFKNLTLLFYGTIILSGFPLQILPLTTQILEIFNLPEEMRSFTVFLLHISMYLFTAVSAFNFTKLSSFIGCSFSPLVSFVFPALYYIIGEDKKSVKFNIMCFCCLSLAFLCFYSQIFYK